MRSHAANVGRAIARTGFYALIAFNTGFRVPDHLSIAKRQGIFWTLSYAIPAVIAEVDHVGIVAVEAIEIAALEEDNGTIARTIDKALGKDLVDQADGGRAVACSRS